MSHFITLNEGATMTSDYRTNRENILDSSYKGLDILPVSETFDLTELLSVIEQTGCVGLRIYYGMDENMLVHAILVGVDENDEDILPSDPDAKNTQIMEHSLRCPNVCPPSSRLNS